MIMIAVGRGARPSTVRILHAEANETHRRPPDDQEPEENLVKRKQATRRWRNHNKNNYYEAEEARQSSQLITLDDEKTIKSSPPRPMPSRTERTTTTLSQRRPRIGHWPVEQNSMTHTRTSKSTINSPPKLFPIISALVHQIVIISLISHKIPPTFASSQLQLDPHNDQRHLVALEPLLTSQNSDEIYISKNQQQLDHQDHKTKTTMSMKAQQQISELHQHQQHKAHRDNHQGADDNQRPHRQRGSSFMKSEPTVARAGRRSLGSASSSSDRFKRHLGELDAPKDGADCRRLAALWLFLQTSYPNLSSHLIEWAGQAAEGASDEQHLLASSSQPARTVGHLLAEAERLMAAVQGGRPATSKPSLHHIRQHSQPQPSWLARVSSNPTYARLVQHLRTRQRANHNNQHHQQRPSAASLSAGLEGVEESALDADATLAGSRAAIPTEDDEQMAVGTSQPHQTHHEQEHEQRDHSAAYGRVFHYPHELANGAENSHGMARTLDKLRLLNHHNRQQQQIVAIGSGSDTSENNRIPLAATPSADVDQMTEGDWRRLGDSGECPLSIAFDRGETITVRQCS